MKHRGLFYFVFLSFFLYVVVFSDIVVIHQNQPSRSLLRKALEKNEKMNPQNYIVETFLEFKKPDNPKYISNLNSKEQGRLTKNKDYSYYSNIRYFSQTVKKTEDKQMTTGDPQSEANLLEKKIKEKKSFVNPLPNFYKRKQFSVNLDSDGMVGLSAEKKPYTQYLLTLAKTIFYNWVRFLPAEQIHKALIITNAKDGVLAGTVVLYFDQDSQRYSVVMGVPYYSMNMNNLTLRSFEYLKLPGSPKDLKMQVLMVRLKVNAHTLRAEANFKFDFYYKDEKVSQ